MNLICFRRSDLYLRHFCICCQVQLLVWTEWRESSPSFFNIHSADRKSSFIGGRYTYFTHARDGGRWFAM